MKKVFRVTSIRLWSIDGGWHYSDQVFDAEIIDVDDDALQKPPDWSWWRNTLMRTSEDIYITVRYYPSYVTLQNMDAYGKPLAQWSTWGKHIQPPECYFDPKNYHDDPEKFIRNIAPFAKARPKRR